MQTITSLTLEDTMYYNYVPVFIYKINFPFFTTTCNPNAAQAINSYYSSNAKQTEEYCRTVLFPQALESARYIQDTRPFNSYSLDVAYTVTYNKGCYVSLYLDTYTYMGGAHGETKRTSDTWSFDTGTQLQLLDIYPLSLTSLSALQICMEQQIADRLNESPGSYFDDYSTLLKNSFHSENFYLQPVGFAIYYQQYDLAPYSTGIPEFYFRFPLHLA